MSEQITTAPENENVSAPRVLTAAMETFTQHDDGGGNPKGGERKCVESGERKELSRDKFLLASQQVSKLKWSTLVKWSK